MNRYFTRRRPKKEPVQPKFELDLSAALPTNDNFRTSLIMNSLSARFSMLREQDDPMSMLGKASDDSVLHPRRQSRLMDFGYSPGRSLHDIAEVSSISSSVRPPFAMERTHSFGSETGYATDDDSSQNGSVMSRARPGEGNMLFGGRQKIYKITAGSEANLAIGGALKGRTLYDDDVSSTTFQKFRQEERERLARQKLQPGADESPSKATPSSPSFPGTITRQTSTSTSTSAPSYGRTSTAATSVASQIGTLPSVAPATTTSFNPSATTGSPVVDRASSKHGRRLYDQGLTREIEDQQTTAMSRLNSIQKRPGRTSPPFARSTSRQRLAYPFRSESPARLSPPGTAYTLDRAVTLPEESSPETSPTITSPSMDHFSRNPLVSSLNPNDRGKATALGAFNKPQQFNEKQYLERQMTLRQGRETPTPREHPVQKEEANNSTDIDRTDGQSIYSQSTYHARSRPAANVGHEAPAAPSPFSVFQRAANQIKTPANEPKERPKAEEDEGLRTNLFFSRTSSDSEYENEQILAPLQAPTLNTPSHNSRSPTSAAAVQPPQHQHPAYRSQSRQGSDSPKAASPQVPRSATRNNHVEQETNAPSDSLNTSNGGLSGLVRQHLRHGSDASSYYEDAPAPQVSHAPSKLALRTTDVSQGLVPKNSEVATPADSSYSNASNPFDLEDLKHPGAFETGRFSPVSPIRDEPEKEAQAESPPNPVRASRRRGMSHVPDPIADVPWQQEWKKSHTRDPSSETLQEQDALSSEIAKRQRAIQERLRAKMENGTPSPTADERPSGPFKGLEALRPRSSRESIKKAAENFATSKPGKMFGLGMPSSAPPDRPSFQSDRFRSEESSYNPSVRSRSGSRPTTSRSASQKPYGYQNGYDSARPSQDINRNSDDRPGTGRDRKNSNPPISALNTAATRSRSNSVQSNGRSRSRGGNGRYKDDLEKAMIEGTSSRGTTMIYPDPPTIPEHYQAPYMPLESPQSLLEPVLEPPQSGHLNIQTRGSPSLYTGPFESTGLFPPPHPIQSPMSASSISSSPRLPIQSNATFSPSLSPRPSPGLGPISPHLMSSQPSPNPFNSSFHTMSTPPLSGASTPVMSNFSNVAPASNGAYGRVRSTPRKQSIKKSDIGEPRLISTTSVIDTVDLPAGASLQNGLDDLQYSAPPLPTMNPLRRKFGFGRSASDENRDPYASKPSRYDYPPVSAGYRHSGDELPTPYKPQHRLRKSSSEGEKIGMRLRAQAQAKAMTSNPSLSRPGGSRPVVEGGMF